MVNLYTSQYGYKGKDRFDITVKSGSKVFAPTWDMVMGHKNGTISDDEYVEMYTNLMRNSYKINRDSWEELLSLDEVTIVCFCRKGKFCHRLLLANFLKKCGANYLGER